MSHQSGQLILSWLLSWILQLQAYKIHNSSILHAYVVPETRYYSGVMFVRHGNLITNVLQKEIKIEK